MSASHRLYCIYSTESAPSGDPGNRHAMDPPTGTDAVTAGATADGNGNGIFITPGRFLERHGRPPPADRMEDHFRRAAQQMPLLVGEQVADQFRLVSDDGERLGTAPTPSAQRLSAFRLPYGGLLACLTLDFDADLAGTIVLLQLTTTHWQAIRLDGHDLVTCLAALGAQHPGDQTELAADVHHLLAVDPGQIRLLADAVETTPLRLPVERRRRGMAAVRRMWRALEDARPSETDPGSGTAGRCPDDIDPQVVEALVFRTLDPIRTSHAEVRYPQGINRRRGSLAAVGTAVTVVRAPAGELEGWLLWSALQLTGSQARLREVRRATYGTLHEMDQELATGGLEPPGSDQHTRTRNRLGELSRRLSKLELDLAFGVAANLDVQFVLPSPMLAHCHRTSASLMGLPGGVQSTRDLLDQATKAVDARYAALGVAQRSHDEVRVRRVTVAAGLLSTVALVTAIFFGFFGANARPVDGDRSFLDADYLGFYLSLVAVIGLIALMFVALRRRYPFRPDK